MIAYPKDPAVLKILRVANSLRVVFLVRRADLLSRRTLSGPRRSKSGGRSKNTTAYIVI